MGRFELEDVKVFQSVDPIALASLLRSFQPFIVSTLADIVETDRLALAPGAKIGLEPEIWE